jgi:hypothetical protein
MLQAAIASSDHLCIRRDGTLDPAPDVEERHRKFRSGTGFYLPEIHTIAATVCQ